MAYKRRKHSAKRRSKRVGAMSLNPRNPIVPLAAVAIGYFMADKINDQLDKVIPMKTVPATATTAATSAPYVSSTITGAGMVGIGGLLALKGKKTIVKTVIGGVLAGAGLKRVLKDQKIITGFQSVPVIGGFQKVPVIGRVPNALNGYTTSRTAALGRVPNALNGYTTSRTAALPIMAGFAENGRMDYRS